MQGNIKLDRLPKGTELRRINLGYKGTWFRESFENGIITYGVPIRAYAALLAGDRQDLEAFYLSQISGETGEPVIRSVVSRYANDLTLFCTADENLVWLETGGGHLCWCQAKPGVTILREYVENNPNLLEDRKSYLLARRTVSGWHTTDIKGHPLKLWALHPKGRDWLTQRGTIGRLEHADYFLALLNADPLDQWHNRSDLMKAAAAVGWRQGLNLPSVPREWGQEVTRMTNSILNTAAHSNGQTVETTVKVKNSLLNESDWHILLRRLLVEQNYRCKITGRKLVPKGQGETNWLQPSVDRIDSDGDYEESNVQVVSWAANRAKGALPPDQVQAFFAALQMPIEQEGDPE